MCYFADLVLKIVNNDCHNNNFNSDTDNTKQLFYLLKQFIMNTKTVNIPFSGKLEFVKSFGKELEMDPYDIKTDNKMLFIADYDKKRIVVFDLNGNYLYQFKTKSGRPQSLYVDKLKDKLFISCGCTIYSCNKKGENFVKFNCVKGRSLVITVDSNFIYAADNELNKIMVFDENDNFKFEFNGNGLQNGYFNKPTALTFNSKRELLVCDSNNNRIQVYNYNGQFIKYIDCIFFHKFILGIAVDSYSNIFLVDYAKEKVNALDENGILINSVERVGFRFPVQLVYCNVNGYLYVCAQQTQNVVIFK